jgi:hypothetical protein
MVHERVATAEQDVGDARLFGDLPDPFLIIEVGRVLGQPQDSDVLADVRMVGVCGAFRYPDGPFLFTYCRLWKNPITEHTVSLLHLLAARARRTGKKIVLVLDNGSTYTSGRSREEIHRL